MREIIFRGKEFKTGRWVHGSLISIDSKIDGSEAFIYPHFSSEVSSTIPCLARVQYCTVPIDANTLGQYTGFTDSNEKKIFEGDILYFVSCKGTYSGIVEYRNTAFCVSSKANGKEENYSMRFISECEKAVVVGNVYDGKKSSVKQYQVVFYDMNKDGDCFDEAFYLPDEADKVLSFVERENNPFASEKSRVFAHFEDGSVYELKLEKK